MSSSSTWRPPFSFQIFLIKRFSLFGKSCAHFPHAQDEFKFYMEDAGTKLLVVGKGGNQHAEETNMAPVVSVGVGGSSGEEKGACVWVGWGVNCVYGVWGRGGMERKWPRWSM